MTVEYLYSLWSKRTSARRFTTSDPTSAERYSWMRREDSTGLRSAGWASRGFCGPASGPTAGGRIRTDTGGTCGARASSWGRFMSSGHINRESCWSTGRWSSEIKSRYLM